MKKILKKNQIIVFTIALMLISAGYLSYTGNKTVETSYQNSMQQAGIGDAKLVNSNAIAVENQNEIEIKEESENEETIVNEDNEIDGIMIDKSKNDANVNNIEEKETKITNSNITKKDEEYFSESRINREKMYSQMLESYQKILESQTVSETQKSIAQTEIQNINSIKNKIMICENLIKTKGIEDIVIFKNDKSISIVVRADNLEQEKIAQIQNIIQREMNAEISDIHISNK